MTTIGIIGGGFSGTMTAIQLIKQAESPIKIAIIDQHQFFLKGIAYNSYSDTHILNVPAAKMSAFPDEPDHFLNWVLTQPAYIDKNKELLGAAFLPRNLYGVYVEHLWKEMEQLALKKGISIEFYDAEVGGLELTNDDVTITLNTNNKLTVNKVVIATGNQAPRNPIIKNNTFYSSPNYFKNPWQKESIENINSDLPILIIGNGLTMVDTLLGLEEIGYKGVVFSLSPNGYNMLPHRHNGIKYTHLVDEVDSYKTLHDWTKAVFKHIKLVRSYGLSAEPVIDSLRPHTQQIWKNLTNEERQQFMSRIRHLWGVARHRIPLNTHDKIQQLRIQRRLNIIAGRLLDINETEEGIEVQFYNKKTSNTETIIVGRVINCTGPDSDISNFHHHFLKKCLEKGYISQDNLKLGLRANTQTFQVLNSALAPQTRIYAIGSLLRGELWETTAVNELRTQAKLVARELLG
jgi:uncharacterized NAD(P)/FAD-binding protein YdhS